MLQQGGKKQTPSEQKQSREVGKQRTTVGTSKSGKAKAQEGDELGGWKSPVGASGASDNGKLRWSTGSDAS